jgi:hypothetical protein
VVESRHKIGSDLSRFLFRYGVGRILFTGLENVFKCTAILGRASVNETTQLTWLEPPAKRRRLMSLRKETVHRTEIPVSKYASSFRLWTIM